VQRVLDEIEEVRVTERAVVQREDDEVALRRDRSDRFAKFLSALPGRGGGRHDAEGDNGEKGGGEMKAATHAESVANPDAVDASRGRHIPLVLSGTWATTHLTQRQEPS
jgi:hypothetical protein